MRADSVSSLIVASGERRGLLGVGFKNFQHDAFLGHEMKVPAGTGPGGLVASRWLGGGKAKTQGRGMGSEAIACHDRHALFRICLCILAFCLDDDDAFITVRSRLVPLIEGLCAQSERLLANIRSVYSYT